MRAGKASSALDARTTVALAWLIVTGTYPLNLDDLAQFVCIAVIELLVYVLFAKAVATRG
jgi:hypothetical protein